MKRSLCYLAFSLWGIASTLLAEPAYFQLSKLNPGTSSTAEALYRLRPLSKGADCFLGQDRNLCQETKLSLPETCGWECQDGILSGQGTAVVEGEFAQVEPGELPTFNAHTGFDTWRAHSLPSPLLKVTGTGIACFADECTGAFQLKNLKTGKISSLKRISFQQADDTNFQLESTRALSSLQSETGLLVTGQWRAGELFPRYVFRQWFAASSCDPLATIKNLTVPTDSIDPWFELLGSEEEAWQGTDGRTLYWAVLLEDSASSLTYRTGYNDLWTLIVQVQKASCEISILGEH